MADSSETQNSTTILIIDDDPGILRLLEDRLIAHGYNVIKSQEAAEGLEMAFKNKPDLIILDVMMPIINGYNFCRLVKSQKEVQHIPIVMVTGRTEESDKEIGSEVGADAYITKPFKMEDILDAVKRLLP